MDGISTMSLSSEMESMTPLFGNVNNQPPSNVPFSQDQLTYSPNIAVGPPPPQHVFTGAPGPSSHAGRGLDKNMGTVQMDSSPISDVMGSDIDYQGQGVYMAPPGVPQGLVQQAPQQQQASSKKGPMNLTPEQMDALLAGVTAVLAFSKPVQEKLVSFIPQMLGSGGETSNIGLLVTALFAALIFYFGRRFIK